MKDSTKRNLKIAGGLVVGIGLMASGQVFLGMALGGISIRAGKAIPGIVMTPEVAKAASSKMAIAMDVARGVICSVVGANIASEAVVTAFLGEKVPKMSVVAPPPDRTPRTIIDADIVS